MKVALTVILIVVIVFVAARFALRRQFPPDV